jgi:hypothetical protein
MRVDGPRVVLHVPVVYADPEHPEHGYADDYSDLPAPSDAGVEEDGSGEWWSFEAADFSMEQP